MRLREIQEAFQAAVLSDEPLAPSSVVNSEEGGLRSLFAVYYNAYRLRLAEILSDDYAVLRKFLGDDIFGSLVEAYILHDPSRVRNARYYGVRLPEFMKESPLIGVSDLASDLARFERSLADSFDAADDEHLSVHELERLSPEDIIRVTFIFHPSVSVCDLKGDTVRRFEAARDGSEFHPTNETDESCLIWRNERVFYRLLGPAERIAIIETMAGKSFVDVCALLAFRDPDEDAVGHVATFLSQWFSDGIISSISLSE